MKVFKYPIKIDDVQRVEMPAGARILSAQIQGPTGSPADANNLCLWALVDDSGAAATVERKIYIRGTGHPAEEVADARYISTVQLAVGALIFHVFDGGEVR